MSLVQILTLRRDLAAVTVALSGTRALHVTQALRPAQVSSGPVGDPVWHTELTRIEKKLLSILSAFSRVTGGHSESNVTGGRIEPALFDPAHVIDEAGGLLSRDVDPAVSVTLDDIRALEEKRERVARLLGELEGIRSLDIDLGALGDLEFVYVTLGYVPVRNLGRLEESLGEIEAIIVPHSYSRDDVFIIAATLTQLRGRLQAALKGAYFRPVELEGGLSGSPACAIERLEGELARIDGELSSRHERLRALAKRWERGLRDLLRRVTLNRRMLEFYSRLDATEETSLITGFVPSDRVEATRHAVEAAAQGRVIFEARSLGPGESRQQNITVPTALRNPRPFRIFEALLATYGYPRYGEFDPTAVLALTYVAMFGFMFGDLGQGAVIALLGALLMAWPPGSLREFSPAGSFLLMCGISACVFGILYGSVFGREGLISALWQRPLESINSFLVAGIIYGIFQNLLGIAIGLRNALGRGDFREALFGEFGAVSAGFYVALLASGYAGFILRSPAWALAFLIAGAVLLGVLAAREPLGRAFFGNHHGAEESAPSGMLPALLGTFDIVLRYLTNSISFVRLPAFAIAHVALGVAIYTVAGAISGSSGGRIASLLVAVLGNAGVIALEGMIVGIQCLRLEFYEFFSKFLSGDGLPYRPWHLESEEGAGSS